MPKKSWDDKTYIYPNEAASRSDISFPEDYQLHKQRGPTPLQRSPVVDNVALKVLSEGRNLKVKQNWTSEDIVSHSATTLTSPCQNVFEQVLLENTIASAKNEDPNEEISYIEKIHTLRYNSGILNSSDPEHCANNDIGISKTEVKQANYNEIKDPPNKQDLKMNVNIDTSDNHAQAQLTNDAISNTLQISNESIQQTSININNTYTQISKPKIGRYLKSELHHQTSPQASIEEEKFNNYADALKVMANDGEGLPYIDETRPCESYNDLSIVTGRACDFGTTPRLQTKILPSLKEETGEIDEETALCEAILEASGLKTDEYDEIVVQNLQFDANSHQMIHGGVSHVSEDSNIESENNNAKISAILVSERKCSGTETVQIKENLINREN